MTIRPPRASTARGAFKRSHVSFACAAVLCLCLAQIPDAMGHAETVTGGVAQTAQSGAGGDQASASATLEQCVTAVAQAERSTTFSGEMTAISGSVRMAMRIDIQEQAPGAVQFHTITAPGLGVWRGSDPGVKTYKYVKQVTNLSAPALYRAAVRFRWLNAKGHVIKVVERHTSRCAEPAPPASTQGSLSTPGTSASVAG
jgi:hypothetical protein